jgi:putative DNA primase/helicase
MNGDEKKIVDFPKTEILSDESVRHQMAEAQRLANLAPGEWQLWIDDSAKRLGIPRATLEGSVLAIIKNREQKTLEAKAEERQREARVKKERAKAEERQKQEQAQADKEAKRKQKEKDKAFASIAKLPINEHEAKLAAPAKQLGEDVEVLREEFAELRSEEEAKIKCGEVEPWDEPVDTRELLDGLATQFGRYIIIHDRVIAPIVPLWIAFAWVHDWAVFSPILVFQGADTEVAKTAASKVVALSTPRAYMIVEPTGPAFYRFTDRVKPTLAIDDADKLLPRRPDLAHIVNSSWMRGNMIPRTDASGNVHLFDPFCPIVLNGINLLAHLAPATRTRCITIQLLPLLEEEKDSIISIRYTADDENFVVLRRKLARWSLDNMAAIKNAKPKMPDGFFSRLEENFHLLFAIADLAGGDWPKKARAGAVKLSREHNKPSLGKRLLEIFFDLSIKHGTLLTSKQLEQLVPAESDEFANYQNGRPINKYQIAALLSPYCNIRPKIIHPRGGKTGDRGYDTSQQEFTRAFRHYLKKTLPVSRSVVRNKKRRK